MRLSPLALDERPKLRDRDAAAPDQLPDADRLAEKTKDLLDELESLQRVFYADARHAMLIVLQARDSGGKDGTIRKVFGAFNPQGCAVTSFKAPTPLELEHDFLWRVHQKVPAHGMIGVFNRSHYEDVLVTRVRELVPKKVWSKRYDHINDFERMLADNGTVIVKFFLHISRDEQRRRLESRLENPEKNWKFRSGDLEDRALWDGYTRAYKDALSRCSTPWAPWYVVPADDKPARNYLVARTVVETLRDVKAAYPVADEATLAEAKNIE